MLLSTNTIPNLSWPFILGVVVLTTAMVAMTRRRLMRQSINPKAYSRQRVEERRNANSAEGDLRDLLLELEKAAREITAQIDTRYGKLEAGMRAADSRIAELRRLTGAGRSEGAAAPAQRPQRLDVVVGDEVLDESARATFPGPASRANDFERVCALADRRLAPREIATQVQRSLSEVELMLAMRKQSVAKDVPNAGGAPG